MTTQHTAGPWTIDTDMRGLHNVPVIGVRSGDEAVANCGTSGQANARLIAAAPDLLAALQALVGEADLGEIDHDDETRALLDNARDAIAKATGGAP